MAAPPPDKRRRLTGGLLLLAALLAACTSDSRQLLDRAEANWRKGRYYEAIQDNGALYRLEQRGRYAARALLNLGNIYYLNLRQLKQAIEFYNKLTQEFPARAEALEAHRKLAGIYASPDFLDLDQAIVEYDKILAAENLEDRADILFQRADAYFKKGDYYRALRELRSLEDSGIRGHQADQISLKIGNIYQIQKKFADAVEPFRKVLTATCQECRRSAILNLAETYENLFEFDRAIETIGKLDKTPQSEQYIQSEIARLNEKRKRIDKGFELEWRRPQLESKTPVKRPAAKKRTQRSEA
jgi:tetratricopeptide (TPR) repeat protein